MENFNKCSYESPFCSRYSSKEMLQIFSSDNKFKIWRKLWIVLAKAEKRLGLPITSEQIEELEKHKDTINYEVVQKREKIVKHDVMAHIFAYGLDCPNASKIIHLGATSCYITDNASIIIMRQALKLIEEKIVSVLNIISEFALKYKDTPCLSYTHLQPAQLTTVGKRAALWLQDFYFDYNHIVNIIKNIKILGSKGATGTQASFLKLFKNDKNKVEELEKEILKEFGFSKAVYISGQTYSRKLDFFLCSVLCEIAQSAMKFSSDIRILQNFKEIEEPFEKNQIGSSAMPYKKNPMKSERICAIARYVIINILNPAFTAASQWFERSLDDSANRRIVIPEMFLAVDAILEIIVNIFSGIVVNEKIIEKRVLDELPFMATENIMMVAVEKGSNRQIVHEKLRKYSLETANNIRQGGKNDLMEKLLKDGEFNLDKQEIKNILNPKNFIGLASDQVENFVKNIIEPILKDKKNRLKKTSSLSV